MCGTSKHNCLVSCSFCWQRHVSATVGHLQVTKMYIEENYTEWGHSQKGKSVPLQAWSASEGSRNLMFPDFVTTAHDECKVVSFTHRTPLPQGNALGTHFCWRLSQPHGHSAIGRILRQRKIPMTPVGIETATFWFAAQHLNHCATASPTNL